jgi:hypothetical protein
LRSLVLMGSAVIDKERFLTSCGAFHNHIKLIVDGRKNDAAVCIEVSRSSKC